MEVLEPIGSEVDGARVVLAVRTRRSRLGMACGMDHELAADLPVAPEATIVGPHHGRVVYEVTATPDRPVRLVKHLAYHHTDATRPPDELCLRAHETLDRARAEGFARIRRAQRERYDRCWADSDVVVEGSPLLQQAVRFSVFQLLQASARVEGHGIPAKGLTGRGYEGQYFWDTEIYVQPFLTYTAPHIARSLLRHRYDMLDPARDRARTLGHPGALFPWRTINGEEASAQYAAGTAQYHINADIAYSLTHYGASPAIATCSRASAARCSSRPRFWSDLGFFSDRKGGRFVINGVTGPDEYSTVVDNNTYTNLMARENLLRAADVVGSMSATAPEAFDRLRARTGLTGTNRCCGGAWPSTCTCRTTARPACTCRTMGSSIGSHGISRPHRPITSPCCCTTTHS